MSSGQNDASTELVHPRRVVPYHRGMIVSTLTRSRAFISQPARGALLDALVLSGAGCAQMLGLDSFLDASGSSGGAGGIPSSATSTDGGGGGASTTTSEGGAGGTSAGGAGGAATSSSVGSGTGGAGGEGGDTTCGGADLLTDRDNCGTCGNVCPVGALSCSEGKCLQVTQLALSNQAACALLTNGTVRCWGSNEFGQLGSGSGLDSVIPVIVDSLTNIVDIFAGRQSFCAKSASGNVRCWGNNAGGFADGTKNSWPTPTESAGWFGASSIVFGNAHACAIVGGGVQCAGDNTYGQLGNPGAGAETLIPVVSLEQPTTTLASGHLHTCARSSDGVWCWGTNAVSLDNETPDTRDTPVRIDTLQPNTVAQLVAGGVSLCARLIDGTARCWGDNSAGQLGNGSTTPVLQPSAFGSDAVHGLTTIRQLATGLAHTYALLDDSAVYCWGDNASGQCGDGTYDRHLVPTHVKGLSGAFQLPSSESSGAIYSCVILDDRQVACWGDNSSGQLGANASGSNSTIPVVIKW